MDLPIYLDHAATTPVDPAVADAMFPYFTQIYGNPSSIYSVGAEAREAIDSARDTIAAAINAAPDEIYFTSGGTEADNWAVKGVAASDRSKRHIITTAIEHHAVLDPCLSLRKSGFEVDFVPVDSRGLVEPSIVANRIRSDTCLVSVMHANNEIGSIQPIEEIGSICRERNVPLHVDAVQTFGKLDVDVDVLGASLLSISAHKIYGPKGVGALYIRRGMKIEKIIEGGEQEKGRRAGTPNVPAIVGFRIAVELAQRRRVDDNRRIAALRDRLIERIEQAVPGAQLSGDRQLRLANNVHFCFDGIEGESLLISLDQHGVCASAGSACTTGSVEPSHVLLALGFGMERARGAIRLTLGRTTTEEEIDYSVEVLASSIRSLRSLR